MNPTNHQMWQKKGGEVTGTFLYTVLSFVRFFVLTPFFFKTMFGWVLGLVMRFEFPTSTPKIKNCKRSFHPFLLKGFSIQYHQLTAGMFAVCVRNVVKIRSTKNWCGNARLEQTRDFLKTLWLMTKELLRAVKLLNIFRWSWGPGACSVNGLVVWGNSSSYRCENAWLFVGIPSGLRISAVWPLGNNS